MKTTKIILVVSAAIFFVVSISFYVITFNYPIDDVELGCIPLYLNPARVFLIAGVLLLPFFIIISKKKKNLNVEKVFACYVSFLLITGICAGVTAWLGYSSEVSDFECTMELQQASEESQKLLPFHDLFFKYRGNYGAYYVAKTSIIGSTYTCANNYIPYGLTSFSYQAESLESTSLFLLFKFYIDKFIDTESIYTEEVIDDINLKKFVNEDNYAVLVFENSTVFYISVSNASKYDVSEEDFLEVALNQITQLREWTVSY